MKNRTLLMIPGPIEFEPKVMAAMGEPTTSHLAPVFIEAFGQSLQNMRQVFESPTGQPLVLAGSGTLAMDTAGANLIEPGDKALVVDTGYFSERFAIILERYGAQVTRISTSPGNRPSLEQIKSALEAGSFKLMTITHVDTSTAVIAEVREIAALGRQVWGIGHRGWGLFGGGRGAEDGCLGSRSCPHRFAESDWRTTRAGTAHDRSTCLGCLSKANHPGAKLLRRLDQLVAQ